MATREPSFRLLSILDEETVPVLGGKLEWLPLRRRLGIRAFGTNAYRAASKGDVIIEDHVESPGQEELYVVLAGSVRFVLGEEELDASAGTAVFVPDAELRRAGFALEAGTVVLGVGGWSDRPYHSLPWEPIFLADEAITKGDWAEAAEILECEAGEHRDSPFVLYRLACCHARLGETERAVEELRRAVEIKPGMRERAESDKDLASVRELI